MSEEIVFHFPPFSVSEMEGRLGRGIDRLGLLWSAGRLQPLLDDTEGRQAIELLERVRVQLMAQWTDALSAGKDKFSPSINAPRAGARLLVAFASRLLDLMADTALMASVGSTALPEEDLATWRSMIAQAETVIASAGRSES